MIPGAIYSRTKNKRFRAADLSTGIIAYIFSAVIRRSGLPK
jgi:hypothetical protein